MTGFACQTIHIEIVLSLLPSYTNTAQYNVALTAYICSFHQYIY